MRDEQGFIVAVTNDLLASGLIESVNYVQVQGGRVEVDVTKMDGGSNTHATVLGLIDDSVYNNAPMYGIQVGNVIH